jgi:hypothetical protein
MKTYRGVDVYIHRFLTSELVGGEWSASRPCRFTPGKEDPVPMLEEFGWTPEPVWAIWRSENFLPYRDSNSPPLVVQPVASRYTDWAIPAQKIHGYPQKITYKDLLDLQFSHYYMCMPLLCLLKMMFMPLWKIDKTLKQIIFKSP